MGARILNVSEEEYFADPCAVPSLTQSIAHTLVDESPLHAWLQHPKLGKQPRAPTKATNRGHVIHKLLLGKGANIEVLDVPDFKKKDAQQMRDDAIALGKIPMKRAEYEEIETAADVLRERLAENGYVFSGESEFAIEWDEKAFEGTVLCRGRMDHVIFDLSRERATILDVKKAASVNPRNLRRHFYEYGYDIQYQAYTSALVALHPELAGRVDFTFLFVEIEPPYSVVDIQPTGAFREMGLSRWTRAIDIWKRCLTRNHWPSYKEPGRPLMLEPMPYHAMEELGAEYAER